MDLGFDTFDTFRFKQLIFVNSAAYAYTRIRIDQHMALFGKNNLGKTSMLNALKLFLLPEVNFRKCASKFNFRGTNGKVFDALASFRWYFPEDRTFIILEAENRHNNFCIVLHRGAATDRQEYARMAVPLPYADIQYLFWNLESAADDGIGAPVESMTLHGTLSALRELGGEALIDKKTIQEKLFTNQPYDKNAGRYSLLPLRNGTRELEAWRKLVHLAFDISAQDDRTLPETLATIIEGQKGRPQEELNIDLNAIVEEANQLREEGDRITRIINASEDWERFNKDYHRELQLRQQAAQRFADLEDGVAGEEQRLADAVSAAGKILIDAEKLEETLRKAERESDSTLRTVTAELKAAQKNANTLKADINAANATINEYHGKPRADIIAHLDGYIDQLDIDIAGFDDKEVARKNLTDLNAQLEQNKRKARQLQEALDNRIPTLLEGLSVRDASILHSLNPGLAAHGELTPEQHHAFTAFSQEFYNEDGYLVLGRPQARIPLTDIPYRGYDAEQTRQRMENELKQLNSHITSEDKRRSSLKQTASMSAEDASKERNKAGKKKDQAIKDKNTLNALDANNDRLGQLETEILEQEAELEEKQRRHEKLQEDWRAAEEDRLKATKNMRAAKTQADQIDYIRRELDSIGKDPSNVFEGLHRSLSPGPCQVTADTLDALKKQERELQTLRRAVEMDLRKMLTQSILPDVESQAHLSAFSGNEIAGFHAQLDAIYANLETQKANHDNRVVHHNHSTHSQVDILRTAKKQVTAFMRTINAEIGQFSISDLEEVRVDYQLHPRFEQLLSKLDNADLLSEELQDHHVYEQLETFQADFFNKDARRTGILLSLDKILNSVSYAYRKRGEESWTTNAQSNGTTMMITTNLLSVLMARLMDPGAQVTMPLVMDEFGSLFTDNMRTARQIAEQHGYCLFVANPNRDSKITQVLGNTVHLGLFHASRAYDESRTVVHHGHCESLTHLGKITIKETNTNESEPSLEEGSK